MVQPLAEYDATHVPPLETMAWASSKQTCSLVEEDAKPIVGLMMPTG